MKNGLDPGRARNLVEAAQLEGTDIFYITYHSPFSGEDAIAFSTVWAEEINDYTRRFQQTEAREVRAILHSEVASLKKQLDDVNRRILEFSTTHNFLGSDSQIVSELTQLGQIDLQLSTARTDASSKAEQIANLKQQIRRQSPIELQLKSAREELANLRATYTDANPLVQAKLQSISYLEDQIGQLSAAGETDLEFYTGTPLGNQLYLDIVGLENELLESQRKIHSLEEIRETTAERVARFPVIINGYQNLVKQRDGILGGLSLLTNRLEETEIFAAGAPGYWQVFQAPDERLIVTPSGLAKPLMLGGAGACAGAAAAFILSLLAARGSSTRSVLECCIAARAPLLAEIPSHSETAAAEAVGNLWLTTLAPRLGDFSAVLVWTAALDPTAERLFWRRLAHVASGDQSAPLRVRDLGGDPLWQDETPPPGLAWTAGDTDETAHLLRAAAFPAGKTRSALENVDFWIAVVASEKSSLAKIVRSRPAIDAYLPPCDGAVACTTPPAGLLRKLADSTSRFITERLSRPGNP